MSEASQGTTRRVKVEVLKGFVTEVLRAAGVPEANAAIAAEVLIKADLRGVDSHGIARLDIYVKRIRQGLIDGKAEPRVIREMPAAATVDGQNGLGQVAGTKAMDLCIKKARSAGAAAVAVRNSNHFGIGAYYALRAVPHDCIGVALSNASPLMVPFGGRDQLLGTNPMAVAIPAGEEKPVVLDMATAQQARGKIEIALRKGEKIPLGWAVDKDGNPTDDPAKALEGSLLPMSGAKGYGLAYILDVFSGVLSGALFLNQIGALFTDFTRPQQLGHFFAAFYVGAFMDVAEFKARMDKSIRTIHESRPAPGFSRVLVPGEPEVLEEEKRLREGVPVSDKVYAALKAVATETGVAVPF